MELDEKNRVLFEHLLSYARYSVKDLSKVLKISKSAIIKRLKFLEENKYVERYDAIINWQKVPFIKKVYFFKIQEMKEFEKEMISRKEVFSLITLSGLYNYQVWCFFKNRAQQIEFEKSIKRFSYEYIEIEKLIFPRVTFFDLPLKIPFPETEDTILNIKKIDVMIMKYMAQGHGRDSFYEMSKKLEIPYDSVHYHGKRILKSGYFLKIIAQPGNSQFTLQTTSLLIKCNDKKSSNSLFELLEITPHVISYAIGKNNSVLVHFLNQTHIEYRKTLSKILNIIPKDKITNVLITHWENVILNNRYPLEYFIK